MQGIRTYVDPEKRDKLQLYIITKNNFVLKEKLCKKIKRKTIKN